MPILESTVRVAARVLGVFVLLSLLCLLHANASADTLSNYFTFGNNTYGENGLTLTLVSSTSADSVVIPATVSGKPVAAIGDNAFASSTITNVPIPINITSIGTQAFYNCQRLATMTIPGSVTNIGANAFLGCAKLGAITVDASNPRFKSLGGVLFNKDQSTLILYPLGKAGGNYTVSNLVTTIQGNAFNSTGLTNITIASSVTTIGDRAFYGCSNLATAYFQGNAPSSIGNATFDAVPSNFTFYYPANATGYTTPTWQGHPIFSYGYDTAYDGNPYSYADLGDSITITHYYGPLGPLIIPQTINGKPVTAIGDSAFYYAWLIPSIVIPETVTSIGNSAFRYCAALIHITIPYTVTNIGSGAFTYCTELNTIDVDPRNTNYASVDGVLFNKNQTELLCLPSGKGPGSYAIPDGVTSIGASSIGLLGFTNITIPNGVTNIGQSAFFGCSNLTAITIPDGVVVINRFAFSECEHLRSVTISSSVRQIGQGAFAWCYDLESMYFQGDAPAGMAAGAFGSHPDLTIYYPSHAVGFSTPLWFGYTALPYLYSPPEISDVPLPPWANVMLGCGLFLTGYASLKRRSRKIVPGNFVVTPAGSNN